MQLALLVGLISTVFAQNVAQLCFPPSCRIDSNCFDGIHSRQGKCCGGVCVQSIPLNRVIGESCTPTSGASSFESCAGTCATGLFCSPIDKKCRALHGPNCNCTGNNECLNLPCVLPNVTGATQRLCFARRSTPRDGACNIDDECISNMCRSNKCASLALGESCSSGEQCTPNNCAQNATGSLVCRAPCPLDQAGCCLTLADCRDFPAIQATRCVGNGTCAAPGLGESCPAGVCRNTSLYCGQTCNQTGNFCGPPNTCQTPNSLPIGNACVQSIQCPLNAVCASNGTRFVCQLIGSIPVGGNCSTTALCAPPGNICSSSNGVNICKANGTTPGGSICVQTVPEECVNGFQCTSNGTNFVCLPTLPVGSPCTTNLRPTCNGICIIPTRDAACSCSFASCNCVCNSTQTVPDGGACTDTRQCKETDSICATNGTCVPVIGRECSLVSDCGNALKYDCSCNRRCYLLNPPTPSMAPTIARPTPCDAKLAAWTAKQPSSFVWPSGSILTPISYNTFDSPFGGANQLVASLLKLSAADQATLIDLVCCLSCPANIRFNSNIFLGYQVDCNQKTLTQLPDTCDDKRNALAFLGCWTTTGVSSAPAASLGFGFLAAAAFLY